MPRKRARIRRKQVKVRGHTRAGRPVRPYTKWYAEVRVTDDETGRREWQSMTSPLSKRKYAAKSALRMSEEYGKNNVRIKGYR